MEKATPFKLHDLMGKGSYGVVCSAVDTHSHVRRSLL